MLTADGRSRSLEAPSGDPRWRPDALPGPL